MILKRVLCTTVALVLFLFCFSQVSFSARTIAKATLSGAEVVHSSDTLSITFSLDGVAITGVQGTITYDPQIMTFQTAKNVNDRGFQLQTNTADGDVHFVLYQTDIAQKLYGNKQLFTLTFKIRSSQQGKKISVSATDLVATNSEYSIAVEDALYSRTIATSVPYPTRLSSMGVSSGELVPAFSPTQTEYTLNVGYDVSMVTIDAKPAYSSSVVDVSSVTLAPDAVTRLYVRVSTSDTYTDYVINAYREKNPSIQESNDTTVTVISLSAGKLTPDFNNDISEYSVTVADNIEQLDVGVAMQSPNAYYVVENNDKLEYGHNSVVITLTAEDEYSTRQIVLDVVREKSSQIKEQTEKSTYSIWGIVVVLILAVATVSVIILLTVRLRKEKK